MSNELAFLKTLEATIKARKASPSAESYTSKLFAKGVNKIAQKVGEEAVEVVIEAKDNDPIRFHDECADLLYHLMILLEHKETDLAAVVKVLEGRHKK